ncbi:MAG: hypothetical protein ACYSUG_07485, partial [Planctomycetota bacterium]
YVGYLAFPIQMTYRYPAMARFMAAHWATDAVHIVPVFGERGALLEHWIFCLFYNWPLTVRRRMQRISKVRVSLPARLWHIPAAACLAVGIFAASHYGYFIKSGIEPTTDNTWFIKPLFCLVFFLSCLFCAAGGRLGGHAVCGGAFTGQAGRGSGSLRAFDRDCLLAGGIQDGAAVGFGANSPVGAYDLAGVRDGHFLHTRCGDRRNPTSRPGPEITLP